MGARAGRGEETGEVGWVVPGGCWLQLSLAEAMGWERDSAGCQHC